MSDKLTPKQALFIAEYLIDGNATRAAIAAGFSQAGAAAQGARLLKRPAIAAMIAERRARTMARLEVTEERVKQELAKLAFYDPGDLYDNDGHLRPIKELDDITRAAIGGVEVETRMHPGGILQSVTKKIKLADKRSALELLGKNLKMFTDVHEHQGKLTLEQLVCGDSGEEAA